MCSPHTSGMSISQGQKKKIDNSSVFRTEWGNAGNGKASSVMLETLMSKHGITPKSVKTTRIYVRPRPWKKKILQDQQNTYGGLRTAQKKTDHNLRRHQVTQNCLCKELSITQIGLSRGFGKLLDPPPNVQRDSGVLFWQMIPPGRYISQEKSLAHDRADRPQTEKKWITT